MINIANSDKIYDNDAGPDKRRLRKGSIYSVSHADDEKPMKGLKKGEDYELVKKAHIPEEKPNTGAKTRRASWYRETHVKPLTDKATSHLRAHQRGVHKIKDN